MMSGDTKMQERDGYPFIPSRLSYVPHPRAPHRDQREILKNQLISVISLLSADVPDLNSPANVDAAKEVREDFPGRSILYRNGMNGLEGGADGVGYKKKVKRLARRSAEEAYE